MRLAVPNVDLGGKFGSDHSTTGLRLGGEGRSGKRRSFTIAGSEHSRQKVGHPNRKAGGGPNRAVSVSLWADRVPHLISRWRWGLEAGRNK
jgi:hypothetical protein